MTAEMTGMTWMSSMTEMTGITGWLEWLEDQNDLMTGMTGMTGWPEWPDDRMTGMTGWPDNRDDWMRQKILKSMLVMHRIRKVKRPTNKKARFTSHLFPLMYRICSLFLKKSVQYITINVFNFRIPLLFCVFSYLWKEIFHEGKAVYGKHVGIFLMFFLPHTKLIFPCLQGNFSYVIFLFHTKLIFTCMQGDLNKSNTRNIFVGCKWKFTFRTKPFWGFATVYNACRVWKRCIFFSTYMWVCFFAGYTWTCQPTCTRPSWTTFRYLQKLHLVHKLYCKTHCVFKKTFWL